LPYILREKEFEVTLNLYYDPGKDRYYLIDIESGDKTSYNLGVAIDLGTTTLQLELIDLNTGETLAFTSDYNPQISYGEDVISRIEFTKRKDGLKILASKVREKIVNLIEEMLKEAQKNLEDINLISFAGNTVMSHLFLELEPKYLREYPYVPVTTEFPLIFAKDLELSLKETALIQLAPCKASYVGGDIVAGVVASRIAEEEPLTLFIDLGTNGEIVLGNKEFLMCASCSAGPAFEGGGIKNGIRAISGAIEAVNIDPISFEPMILTIEKKPPKGICGSGIIEAIAWMRIRGIIDEAGRIRKGVSEFVKEDDEGLKFVIVPANASATGRDIVLTQKDIRTIQLAKAAIYAALSTLTRIAGLEVRDLERIFIAGAFGNYLDILSAQILGMLPDVPQERFSFIGNGAIAGASMTLLSKDFAEEAQAIAKMVKSVELNLVKDFQSEFVKATYIPHMEKERFEDILDKIKHLTGINITS